MSTTLRAITADTNVLVRAVMNDDPKQARRAATMLAQAERIAIALPALCEFVWVLRKVYGLPATDAAAAIRALTATANVEMNRAAVEAGLTHLDAGGDFADGVIAFEGRWLGGETFASFDREAVTRLSAQGHAAHLL